MSATFRGSVRNENDLYMTPASAFMPMMPYLLQLPSPLWDPAEGDGRLVRWMNEWKNPGWQWTKHMSGRPAFGTDLASGGGDFLKCVDTVAETICTNPPFSLAFEFCQHALTLSDNVVMLLRLNFLASVKRRDWFQKNPPNAIFVLSKRPSFVNNKTDACDYGFVVWSRHLSGIHFL